MDTQPCLHAQRSYRSELLPVRQHSLAELVAKENIFNLTSPRCYMYIVADTFNACVTILTTHTCYNYKIEGYWSFILPFFSHDKPRLEQLTEIIFLYFSLYYV